MDNTGDWTAGGRIELNQQIGRMNENGVEDYTEIRSQQEAESDGRPRKTRKL